DPLSATVRMKTDREFWASHLASRQAAGDLLNQSLWLDHSEIAPERRDVRQGDANPRACRQFEGVPAAAVSYVGPVEHGEPATGHFERAGHGHRWTRLPFVIHLGVDTDHVGWTGGRRNVEADWATAITEADRTPDDAVGR